MTKKLYPRRPSCHCTRKDEDKQASEPKRSPEIIGHMAAGKPSKLCPQQRFAKRPKHSGMITFDNTLCELPLQKSRPEKRSSEDYGCHSFSLGTDSRNSPERSEATTLKHQSQIDTASAPPSHIVHPREEQSHTIITPNNIEHSAMLDDLSHALSDYSIEVLYDRVKYLFSDKLNNYGDRGSDGLECRMPEYSISMGALLYETMFIYRLLARTDPSSGEAAIGVSSDLLYNASTWQILCTLRRGLVLDSHDLSHVAQTVDAPEGIRCLATRFNTTSALVDCQMKDLLQWVRQMPQNYLDVLLESFVKTNASLVSFRYELTDVGINSAGWQKVEDNLHTYESVIFGDALTEDRGSDHNRDAVLGGLIQNKKSYTSSDHSLNSDPMEQYSHQDSSSTTLPRSNLEQIHDATELALKTPALFILSGWLCLGPHIAQTFEEFCKVFKFLAWRGTTL